MQAFRRLSVWRKAHELTIRVYRSVDGIRGRHPALGQPMARAAHTIAASIAEGSGGVTADEFGSCLHRAIGSARQLDYFLRLAVDLELIARTEHATLEARTDEVIRMLVGLQATVMRAKRPRLHNPKGNDGDDGRRQRGEK